MEMTIAKCNPNKKGGYVVKMVANNITTTDDLGKTSSKTYFVSLQKSFEVGQKVNVDLDQYKVSKLPFTIPEGPQAGLVIELDWLMVK